MEIWRAIVEALAVAGFSPGELLGVGAVWVAVRRQDRRLSRVEAQHRDPRCPARGDIATNPEPLSQP